MEQGMDFEEFRAAMVGDGGLVWVLDIRITHPEDVGGVEDIHPYGWSFQREGDSPANDPEAANDADDAGQNYGRSSVGDHPAAG